MQAYEANCMPGHKPIPVDNLALEGYVADREHDFQSVFDHNLEALDPADCERYADTSLWIDPEKMQAILRSCFPRRRAQLDFLDWIQRKYGSKRWRVPVSGFPKPVWRYRYLAPK